MCLKVPSYFIDRKVETWIGWALYSDTELMRSKGHRVSEEQTCRYKQVHLAASLDLNLGPTLPPT